MSLEEARRLARDAQAKLRVGIDIVAERKAQREAAKPVQTMPTFREAADAYISVRENKWRSEITAQQVSSRLGAYVHPVIGAKPVDTITTADVERVLAPIWTEKHMTASRIRGVVEAVLDCAASKAWRTGDNPARRHGPLHHLLPKPAAKVEHHAALPYGEVAAFLPRIRSHRGNAALCLEFAILTPVGGGEARGATWVEIDLTARLWTVPAERAKAGREHEHVVPLSDSALALLQAVAPAGAQPSPDALIFPGQRGKPPSDVAMLKMVRLCSPDVPATPHGFRSSFRDRAGDCTDAERDVAEAALAHTLRDGTEAAYRRGTALAKRRVLMDAWASYCDSTPAPATAEDIAALEAASPGRS